MRDTIRPLFLALIVLAFGAGSSAAQLGVCTVNPTKRSENGGSLSATQYDEHVTATRDLCSIDLQDFPVAAAALNLSDATVVRIPFGTSDPATCEDEDLFLRSDTETLRICTDGAANTWADLAGGGGGSAIVLDLGDDASNESAGITEIATSGDTNSIFNEPSADKLLVDLSNNWPSADDAQAIDADGDGTGELFISAGIMVLDPDDDGVAEMAIRDATSWARLTAGAGIEVFDSFRVYEPMQFAGNIGPCLDSTGGDIYHDDNCNGSKDGGEEFVNQAGGGSLTVEEEDGTPSVSNVTEINVTNGTLTDNGSGSVSISTGGGGSGTTGLTHDAGSDTYSFDGDEDATAEFVMDAADARLGVGTTSPDAPFHVDGDGTSGLGTGNSALILSRSGGAVGFQMRDDDTSDFWLITMADTASAINLSRNGTGTTDFSINEDAILTLDGDSAGIIVDQDGTSNQVGMRLSSDRLYHDTDADGTQDAGERYIDGFYHPDREPVDCYECEEWDGGADDLASWTQRNVDGSSVLTYKDRGLLFDAAVTGSRQNQAYMRAAPSSQDFAVTTRVGGVVDDDGGHIGLLMVVEGTEATPTRLFACQLIHGFNEQVEMAEYSDYDTLTDTAAGTLGNFTSQYTVGADAEYLGRGILLQLRWDDSEDLLTCHASHDGYQWFDVGSEDLTSSGDAPVSHGVFANLDAAGESETEPFYYWFRVRTDTAGLAGEAGE